MVRFNVIFLRLGVWGHPVAGDLQVGVEVEQFDPHLREPLLRLDDLGPLGLVPLGQVVGPRLEPRAAGQAPTQGI
jgi:hypothetical protein